LVSSYAQAGSRWAATSQESLAPGRRCMAALDDGDRELSRMALGPTAEGRGWWRPGAVQGQARRRLPPPQQLLRRPFLRSDVRANGDGGGLRRSWMKPRGALRPAEDGDRKVNRGGGKKGAWATASSTVTTTVTTWWRPCRRGLPRWAAV
jgi:hypothetical protein